MSAHLPMGKTKIYITDAKICEHNMLCRIHVNLFQSRSKFDSSRDRGDQFSFNIGKSEVKT